MKESSSRHEQATTMKQRQVTDEGNKGACAERGPAAATGGGGAAVGGGNAPAWVGGGGWLPRACVQDG